jgi:pyruvate dehydrogenase E2 component (dihydrolipoamide acetyltransferase)
MSEQTFTLPDLGEGLTEAEIVHWLVAVGDVITVDQVVVEVETAKSLVEVPSPYAGAVSVLHAEEGKTLDVGKPLISVTAGGAAAAGHATAAEDQYREEEQAGSGNVLIGYGTSEASTARRRRAPRSAVSPVPEPQGASVAGPNRVPRVTSPLVRRMARDAGLAVAAITGTGPDGLITRRDVEAAIVSSRTVTAPTATPADQPSSRTGLEIAERVPMSGFRKAVSAALSRSRSEIPEATVTRLPEAYDISLPVQTQLIVELLSR